MTSREAIMYFIARARENAKAKRKCRRQECLSLANWHEGKEEAYLHAARMMKGREAKVLLHWQTGQKVRG